MLNQIGNNERRRDQRVSLEMAVQISVGSQITVSGALKDLSLGSAFIKLKSNIFLNVGDEVTMTLETPDIENTSGINILARISRSIPAEGFAVYFLSMDENSLSGLKKILKNIQKNNF